MKKWIVLIITLTAGVTWAFKARVTDTVEITVESFYRSTRLSKYGAGISGVMVVVTDKGEYAFPESRAAHHLSEGERHRWLVSRPLIGDERPLVEAQRGPDGSMVPIREIEPPPVVGEPAEVSGAPRPE